MIIGFLSLELYLPYSHSLKEKRRRLVPLKDRFRRKYNVAFAELEYQNKWQRSKIGLVTLNNQKIMIEKIFHQIITDVEEIIDGEIIRKEIIYY